MNDLISRNALEKDLKKEIGKNDVLTKDIVLEFQHILAFQEPVEAIPINRLAEIMVDIFKFEPPCFYSKNKIECDGKCKNPYFDDYKSCWKEFFRHYVEVEE